MTTTSILIAILIAVFTAGFVAYAMIKAGKDEDRRNPYE